MSTAQYPARARVAAWAVHILTMSGLVWASLAMLATIHPRREFTWMWVWLLVALVVFMALDYVTGLMCAVAEKKLSSAVGFRGICKKVLILMLVGLANIVDLHVVGTGSALRGAVICFYLSNEGLSLLENAAHIGLPVPDKLKDVLAQLHRREEKSGETGKIE